MPTLIAVAEAEVCGKNGWAVIESPAASGTGCYWYEAQLRPADAFCGTVLKEHAGRRLLGWQLQPERSNVVRVPPPGPIPPEILARNFERMVRTAQSAGRELREALMSRYARGKIPGVLESYASSIREVGAPQRFLDTATLLLPMIEDGETAARMAQHLAKFGDPERARQLLARIGSGELAAPSPPSGTALLAMAHHSAGDTTTALAALQPALASVASEFKKDHGTWQRWRLRYQKEQYEELLSALRQCTGDAFASQLAAWGLPGALT